jgi:hypothetical protein
MSGKQGSLFGVDEPAAGAYPKPPSKVAQVCAEIKEHAASKPAIEVGGVVILNPAPPSPIPPDHPTILRYELYNRFLAEDRNALVVAVARAIAFIRAGQEMTAVAVLEEAKERVEKGPSDVPSPQ